MRSIQKKEEREIGPVQRELRVNNAGNASRRTRLGEITSHKRRLKEDLTIIYGKCGLSKKGTLNKVKKRE